MEPIILYLKSQNIKVDYVVMLGTKKTGDKYSFTIDNELKHESAESYFNKYILSKLGDDTQVLLIKEKESDVETVKAVINEFRQIKKKEKDIKLSIDMHGGLRNTQMLIQNIITLLQYESILPDEIYSVSYDNNLRVGNMTFVKDTYDINYYVAGMSEFMSFGRSRTLESYYKDKDQDFIELIKEISDSIQLCQIERFDTAIDRMRNYVNKYQEKGVYNDLFISAIRSSYGELMFKKGKKRVINKIKWCVRNDFLQQALTIIESQMPKEFIEQNIIDFKTEDGSRVKLYQKTKDGELREIVGGIVLKDAINHKKQNWEKLENYALILWIKENCCDKKFTKENGKKKQKPDYINRITISGTVERAKERILEIINA